MNTKDTQLVYITEAKEVNNYLLKRIFICFPPISTFNIKFLNDVSNINNNISVTSFSLEEETNIISFTTRSLLNHLLFGRYSNVLFPLITKNHKLYCSRGILVNENLTPLLMFCNITNNSTDIPVLLLDNSLLNVSDSINKFILTEYASLISKQDIFTLFINFGDYTYIPNGDTKEIEEYVKELNLPPLAPFNFDKKDDVE